MNTPLSSKPPKEADPWGRISAQRNRALFCNIGRWNDRND
jgi:hypothetical protein